MTELEKYQALTGFQAELRALKNGPASIHEFRAMQAKNTPLPRCVCVCVRVCVCGVGMWLVLSTFPFQWCAYKLVLWLVEIHHTKKQKPCHTTIASSESLSHINAVSRVHYILLNTSIIYRITRTFCEHQTHNLYASIYHFAIIRLHNLLVTCTCTILVRTQWLSQRVTFFTDLAHLQKFFTHKIFQ